MGLGRVRVGTSPWAGSHPVAVLDSASGLGDASARSRRTRSLDWIVLIGVVVIVIGFLMKLDVIAVVVVAALATTLAAGTRSSTSWT